MRTFFVFVTAVVACQEALPRTAYEHGNQGKLSWGLFA